MTFDRQRDSLQLRRTLYDFQGQMRIMESTKLYGEVDNQCTCLLNRSNVAIQQIALVFVNVCFFEWEGEVEKPFWNRELTCSEEEMEIYSP